MDEVAREIFELRFKICFYLDNTGDAFQSFFSDVMEKRYPGDFQRVRPWGNIGDRKNDGYLKSKRTLFQVYAPDDMAASEAIAKINEDFLGALPFWSEHFDVWTFVHNAKRGLGPTVVETLLVLERDHSYLSVTNWGYEEIRQVAFQLSEADLASLLGPAPNRRDVADLRISDLEVVILGIAAKDPTTPVDLSPVPPGKIAYNALSDNAKNLLHLGMGKAHLVEEFFHGWTQDPEFGDRIAETLTQHYQGCRNAGLDPDMIFGYLHRLVRQSAPATPSNEIAALAVLAYFFERCDIFERPEDEAT